jgi:uncharacterized membrane-anchored protein
MLPKHEPRAAKVPEIGVLFWIIKVLTTGIGESTSDFLGQTFIPLAAVVGVFGFWYALRRQFAATAYHAPTYWLCVLMVAVFGTMAADGVHDGVGVSYAVTTPFWALVVAVLFWRWHRAEGTLSIHSIVTRSREKHYWGTVFATFALGTAAGDLTGIQLNMGFFPSALLFAAVIAVPLLWWRFGGLNATVAFWGAYVVTRPLGASFADWFGKPHGQSGLGLGDGPVSLVGLIAFAALVAVVAIRKRDIQPHLPHPQLGRDVAPAEA